MLGKFSLKRMTGLVAALATVALTVPTPAQAQVWYSEACIQRYRDYCAANWQSQGFSSSAQCAEHYKETVCKGYISYEDYYLLPPSARSD